MRPRSVRKYARLVPYILTACAFFSLVFYLLNKPSQVQTKDNVVSLPWRDGGVAKQDIGGVALDDTLLSRSTARAPIPRKRRNSDTLSPVQSSRNVALDLECQSKNKTLTWRSLSDETRNKLAQRIVVSDDHKLLYCAVPLLSMGPWMKVMYYISPLGGEVADVAKVPGKELGTRKNFVYLSSYSIEEQEQRLKSYLSFMVSRHPFLRLAVTYRLKFESSNTFFHDRYGRDIIKNYRTGFVENDPSGDDVKFSEFARFVSESKTREMNEHWQPLESLCQPCAVDYDLVLHHETLEKDSRELLEMARLTDLVGTLPSDKWENVEMAHVSSLFRELPPSLVGRLVKVYKEDFSMFSYSSLF